MRLQLPTPATSEPPRTEVGGVAPRRPAHSDAQNAIPAKESDFSAHLMQRRSEDAALEQARTAPEIEPESTASSLTPPSEDTPTNESADPADGSQELPVGTSPATDQSKPLDDPAVEGPLPFTVTPPAVIEQQATPTGPVPEGVAGAMGGFGSLTSVDLEGPVASSSFVNGVPNMSGGSADVAEHGMPSTGEQSGRMISSTSAGATPSSQMDAMPSAGSMPTNDASGPNAKSIPVTETTESAAAVDRSLRQAVDSSSNRVVREASAPVPSSAGESSGVTRSAQGIENVVGASSSATGGDSSSSSDSKQDRGGSLAKLLKAHALDAEPSASSSSVDPAVSRIREVQQQLAHEHAMPMNAQRPNAMPQAAPTLPGTGVDVGALEGRNTVLNNVLARSGAEAKLAEQTTQLTARGMSALASQRGGSLNIRLNPNSLGEVAIRMTVVEGVVRADLIASSAAARAMLEGGLDVLRGSMESRGLTVDRLVVQAAQAAGDSSGVRSESQNQGQSNQGGAREQGSGDGRQDAAGHESRGRGEERRDRSDGHDQRYSDQPTSFVGMMDEEST